MTKDQRLFDIACSFPALQFKGVEKENIPGITKDDFLDLDLANYLYQGRGGALSSGEFLILEALLNLCNPDLYKKFNLGDAMHVLDPDNMKALLNAIVRTYTGK
jgi:hypothetical protein